MGVIEQTVPAAPAAEAIKINFEKYKLDNGLEVILSEDHRLPIVALNLWYHVGPANERPGRTGFAHLFEHMMFQGSRHVGGQPIKVLETAGATQINGTTGFDRTNYFETLPADQLELGLWFESDRMAFLLDTLTARNLANQRDVVRNERRQGENAPYKLVQEELFRQLFPAGHPYHASIIGSHADIEAVRLEDVREFCRQYYAPNNASLALVGDFDSAEARRLIEKYFGPIPAGRAVPKVDVKTAPIDSPRRVTLTDRVELPQVNKAWLTAPIFRLGDAEADVLAHILGGGRASRLYQRLVYEKQIAQDAGAYLQSMMLGSVFMLVATAKPGVAIEDLEKALQNELAELQSKGPTSEELERAKNSIETQFVLALEQSGGMSGVADRLNTYNHYLGSPDYVTQDLARYDAVTPADVQHIACQLTEDTSITVVGVPGPKVLNDVPKRSDIEFDVAHAQSQTDTAWRSLPPKARHCGLPDVPEPKSFALDNGLKVLWLEQHHVPAVAASLVTLSGSGANPADLPGLASFTADMFLRGTSKRSQGQLSNEIERLGTHVSVQSNSDCSTVGLQVLKKHADRAFELLADIVRNPALEPEEVERLRRERLTSITQLRDNPGMVADQELASQLYGHEHPYGYLEIGTEESNKKIGREDLSRFHSSAYTPGSAAIVVVGDTTEAELRPLVEKHFGNWSGSPRDSNPPEARANGSRRIVILDRPASPQTQLVMGQIGVARSHPDYVATELMNTLLGGMFSSRINTNLREVHGYTYGSRSRFSYRRSLGPFTVSAAVRTDATAAAVAEVLGEVGRLRETPATAEELAIAKEYYTRSLASRFQTIMGSAASVGDLFVHSLERDEYRNAVEEIAATTLADVQRVARYLDPGSFVVVAAGDAAKIENELRALDLGSVSVVRPQEAEQLT
ncbi:MAG: M16 family metallopeptidase [Terriglobales bacterium]